MTEPIEWDRSSGRRARALLAAAGLLLLCSCGLVALQEDRQAPGPESWGPGRLAPSLAATALGAAVSAAVESHPSLAAGAAQVEAARARHDSIRSGALPQLSLGFDMTLASAMSGPGRALPVLEVSQLLFDGGATRANLRSGRAGIQQAATERESMAAGIALDAVEAWYELLHYRGLMPLADENLAAHERYLAQTEERVGAGAGGEVDLLTARSRLADARTSRLQIADGLARAEAAMRRLFGTVPAGMGRAFPSAPPLPRLGDADLVEHSPRLRGLLAEIAMAEAALEAARASLWPALVLQGAASRQPGQDWAGAASLEPRVTLTGGQRAASIAAAEANVAQLQAEAAGLRRDIAAALDNLRADARTGAERLAAARAAEAANREAVVAVADQFVIGRRSISNVLDAQRDLFEAQIAAAAAERDLALSGYAALALTGDILAVFGLSPGALPAAAASQ